MTKFKLNGRVFACLVWREMRTINCWCKCEFNCLSRRKGREGQREGERRESTRRWRKSENDSIVQCHSEQTNFAADKTAFLLLADLFQCKCSSLCVDGEWRRFFSFSGCFRCPLKFQKNSLFPSNSIWTKVDSN